jgi:excisionase family DNA binding protein
MAGERRLRPVDDIDLDTLSPGTVEVIDRALVDRLEDMRVLSVPDAARLMGISDNAVYRLLANGRLPETRTTPGRVGVTQGAVARYIRANTNI